MVKSNLLRKLLFLIPSLFLFTQVQAQQVDVIGKVKIADGTEGLGKVLVSDADGLASWSSPGLSIGDTHAGGIIFYLDGSRQHGLVAKATDEPGEYAWALDDSSTSRRCLQPTYDIRTTPHRGRDRHHGTSSPGL